jgi:hypothetical protein
VRQLLNEGPCNFVERGPHVLKGVPGVWPLYGIAYDAVGAAVARPTKRGESSCSPHRVCFSVNKPPNCLSASGDALG